MARITVMDCIDKFPSRFELVLVASNRARKLYSGETPTVEIDNDKNTVIALREIAQESMSIENLKNEIYKFTSEENFKKCKSMGELMEQTLDYLKRNYQNVSLIDLI